MPGLVPISSWSQAEAMARRNKLDHDVIGGLGKRIEASGFRASVAVENRILASVSGDDFRVGQRCPLVAILLERRHGELLGDIAQPKTAIHAGAVVEIDNAAAVLTFEEPQENLSVVGPTQRTWQPPVQPCLPR